MKLKILTLILFVAVVIFIAIQEPIAAAIFAGIIIFLVVANSIDESKSTITQLEKSIAKDKELIVLLNKERDELNQRIATFASNEATHKGALKRASIIADEYIVAGNCLINIIEEKDKEIVNLNATIIALNGTIDLRKKKNEVTFNSAPYLQKVITEFTEDKELFNELLVKNEELEKKIAKHKQSIKVAESIAHASIDAGHCLIEERNCLKRDIVNLNATIKELSTTINIMKAKDGKITEILSLNECIKRLRKNIEEYQSEQDKLLEEIQCLKNGKATLQTALDANKEKMKGLKEEISLLKAIIEEEFNGNVTKLKLKRKAELAIVAEIVKQTPEKKA